MKASVPPIALTCGDPAGVGPELALKAIDKIAGELPFFWIGDAKHLPRGSRYEIISSPAQCLGVPRGTLPVLEHVFPHEVTPGTGDARNSAAVIDVIKRGVELVQTGQASALCTSPIHKKLLKDGANFAFPGHTEFLAHLAGQKDVVMMLACSELRVVPTTIHIPLKDVPEALTPALLRKTIEITRQSLMTLFGIKSPRLALAGLNPHAGEQGAMGTEELEWMNTLTQELRAEGIDIKGPLPPDTMFHARARSAYDVAICAYHDQALIPIKTLDFDRGVNVTLGLPFIRTSPDHGTAFDIAGKNIAKPDSLIASLRMAYKMAVDKNNTEKE